MNAKTSSAWVLSVAMSFGFGILLGCDTHSRSANAAKPTDAQPVQPLFTPQAATLAQQKMCGEQAEKNYRENMHGDLDAYTSHYDPTVNVCYTRVTSFSGAVHTDVVTDAFGGRVYAVYIGYLTTDKPPAQCEIHIPGKPDETCKTATDFNALTEKYFGLPN